MRASVGVMLTLASLATMNAPAGAREMSLEPPPPPQGKRDRLVAPFHSRGGGRAAGKAFLERNLRKRGRR